MSDIKQRYDTLVAQLWPTQLLAVTKYQSDAVTLQAIQSWITLIWESRVQDAPRKHQLIHDAGLHCEMHMIGHLQTNKVKDAIQIFDTMQSVDSEKLLRKIDHEVSISWHKEYQKILLQLNLSWESQKYGFDIGQLAEMLSLCDSLPYIRCEWLMCMGALWDVDRTRDIYTQCRSLCDVYDLQVCSIGMSGDREIAVQAWSTMVRLWSALFINN